MPAGTAEVCLDLLFKINSELPSENRGGDDDFGQLAADVVGRLETEPVTHRSAQTLHAFPGTLCQTQTSIGESILPIPLSQTIGERNDPRVGGDHRQVRVGIAAQNKKAISDDLRPEPALSGSPLAKLAVHHASGPVEQEQTTQLRWRHVNLKLDAETMRNDVGIPWWHQLDPGARQRNASTGLLLVTDGRVLDLPARLAENRGGHVWVVGCKQGGKHS